MFVLIGQETMPGSWYKSLWVTAISWVIALAMATFVTLVCTLLIIHTLPWSLVVIAAFLFLAYKLDQKHE